MTKKALIVNPYLDTLGGGEKYTLYFALGLAKLGFHVDLAWDQLDLLDQARTRFGDSFSQLTINPEVYSYLKTKSSLYRRFQFTKNYDLIFWVSDGSLPFLFSRKNLVHFQVPFKKEQGNPILNRLKIYLTNRFIYNSVFTKNVLSQYLPTDKGEVLYPPIDVTKFHNDTKKEKIIISVARFGSPLHSKRQDLLINAFKKLVKEAPDYRLYLCGGLHGDDSLIAPLKDLARGLPIEFVINPDFDKLNRLYARAKFFWHAAGHEVNETTNPEKVEHFGIVTVEAMAAGCVPVVIDKGGQREIITPDSGLLCNTPEEMVSSTLKLINDPKLCTQLAKEAVKRSTDFSIDKFYTKQKQILGL